MGVLVLSKLIFALFLTALAAAGQDSRVAVAGVVTDAQGATVVGAKVVITTLRGTNGRFR